MSKPFLFLSSLLTILTFFSNLSNINSVQIEEITDSNINSFVGDGTGQNWLLMFYLDTCPYCQSAKESFISLSKRDEIETDETLNKIKIGQIECTKNNWSCLRFNITRVPTIVQLKHDKLFEFKKYASAESLLNFIAEEKLVSEGKSIPEQFGLINMATRVMGAAVDVLNEQISDFLNSKMNLEIQWTSSYTVALLALLLVFIISVEYCIIKMCLGKSGQSNKVEEKKEEAKNEEDTNQKTKKD